MEYRHDNVHDARMNNDARLAALLAAQSVALVMSLDGSQIFWATQEGMAFVGGGVRQVNGVVTIPEEHALARQIASFAAQLPVGGPARLVRLRLPSAGIMEAVTCRAVRFPLPNGACGVLLVALDAPARRPVSVDRSVNFASGGSPSSLRQTQDFLENALAATNVALPAVVQEAEASHDADEETAVEVAPVEHDYELLAEKVRGTQEEASAEIAEDVALTVEDAESIEISFDDEEPSADITPEVEVVAKALSEETSSDAVDVIEEAHHNIENDEETAPEEDVEQSVDSVEVSAEEVVEQSHHDDENVTAETSEEVATEETPEELGDDAAEAEQAAPVEISVSSSDTESVSEAVDNSVDAAHTVGSEESAVAEDEASGIVATRSGSRVPRRLVEEALSAASAETQAPVEISLPQAAADEDALAQAAPQAEEDADSEHGNVKPLPVLRLPLRFVWQSDAEGKIAIISPEIVEVLDLDNVDIIGKTWLELARIYGFEDSARLENALSRRDTWSGVVVNWPIRSSHMLSIELAGLPVFDRERQFQGFRGFGVVRDNPRPLPPGTRPTVVEKESVETHAEIVIPERNAEEVPPLRSALAAVNETTVVSFPDIRSSVRAPAMDMSRPDLNTTERIAFSEIARSLGAQIAEPNEDGSAQDPQDTAQEDTPPEDIQNDSDVETAAATAQEILEVATIQEPLQSAVAGEAESEGAGAQEDEYEAEEQAEVLDQTDEKTSLVEETAIAAVASNAVPDETQAETAVEEVSAETEEESVEAVEQDEEDTVSENIHEAVQQFKNNALADVDAATEVHAVEEETSEDESSEADEAEQEVALEEAAQHEDEKDITQTPAIAAPSAPTMPFLGARSGIDTEILEAMPLAVLVHRLGAPIFANRLFFELTGFEDLGHLAQSGVDALFEDSSENEVAGTLSLRHAEGHTVKVDVKLHTLDWDDGRASLMLLTPLDERTETILPLNPVHGVVEAVKANLPLLNKQDEVRLEVPAELIAARLAPAPENNDNAKQAPIAVGDNTNTSGEAELKAVLDIASDGVLVVDTQGRMLQVNRTAQELFGLGEDELVGRSFTLVLSAESHRNALDYLDGMKAHGIASVLNEGREVLGMSRKGGAVPLFMKVGRVTEGSEPRFCIVLRDISQFKKAEEELRTSKRQAELASSQKSDFLARVSHEVRTPLNAILGFAEVMMEERFGPLGNERYKDYLKDIHASGNHVISLVNDLLDLSKIEAGKLDLDFTSINLNEVVASAVSLLQPQANRNRIIIRTSLAEKMPSVVADERSLKQIALNLLSNAVKFTPAGGQVIVSTGLTDLGQAVIRVRDSGNGMTEKEIATALEPFRQLATTNASGGTGLGLPLTKALVEANRATFAIQSAVDNGTLVEVIFPPTRVLAE